MAATGALRSRGGVGIVISQPRRSQATDRRGVRGALWSQEQAFAARFSGVARGKKVWVWSRREYVPSERPTVEFPALGYGVRVLSRRLRVCASSGALFVALMRRVFGWSVPRESWTRRCDDERWG